MRLLIAVLVFLVVALHATPAAVTETLDSETYWEVSEAIQQAEGFRSRPYRDRGAWAIGYGRNLNARGISQTEALFLLRNDVCDVADELDQRLPWWRGLNGPRRAALIEMGYNLGVGGLLGFERMLAALRHKQWYLAEAEALDSIWARQVGSRATRLALQLRSGEWQP